jgi:hypothetical protein
MQLALNTAALTEDNLHHLTGWDGIASAESG